MFLCPHDTCLLRWLRPTPLLDFNLSGEQSRAKFRDLLSSLITFSKAPISVIKRGERMS